METGIFLYNPRGERELVCAPLLLWLADLQEANVLCHIYPMACHECFDGVPRTREFTQQVADILLAYARTDMPTALKLQKYFQQSIGYPAFTELRLFQPHTDIPAPPGHCEHLGRTGRHLRWILETLNTAQKTRVDQKAKEISNLFPSYCHFNTQPFSKLVNQDSLMAKEYQFILAIAPWVFESVISGNEQVCILTHCQYAAEYYRKEWSPQNVGYWRNCRQRLLERFNKNHSNKSLTFPKMHALLHEEDTLLRFGSLVNISEMNCEQVHQKAYQNAILSNRYDLENQLLIRVRCEIN